jgi:hypothetical protein
MRQAGVAALALLAAACGPNVHTSNYASAAEARPAVEQGLVPRGLPESAVEMRAAYDPEGSDRWGLFNFPPAGAEELRALLHAEEMSLTGVRCGIPPRVEWWPVQLRRELDDERIRATGARAYRAKSGNLIFVVNWAQGRAYYFTPR